MKSYQTCKCYPPVDSELVFQAGHWICLWPWRSHTWSCETELGVNVHRPDPPAKPLEYGPPRNQWSDERGLPEETGAATHWRSQTGTPCFAMRETQNFQIQGCGPLVLLQTVISAPGWQPPKCGSDRIDLWVREGVESGGRLPGEAGVTAIC